MKPITKMRSDKIMKTTMKMLKAMKNGPPSFLESNIPVFLESKGGSSVQFYGMFPYINIESLR
jgi:hypothetical protein